MGGSIRPDFDPFASAKGKGDQAPQVDMDLFDPFAEAKQATPSASKIATATLSEAGVNPLVSAVATLPIKVGETIVQGVSHPLETLGDIRTGIGQGVQGVRDIVGNVTGQEGVLNTAGAIANTAKVLIYDSLVRPLAVMPLESALSLDLNYGANFGGHLSEEEALKRGEEAAANWAGLLTGAAVGKAFTAVGKSREIIQGIAGSESTLAKAINPTTVAQALANISDDVVQVRLIDELANLNKFNYAKKGIIEGTAGGVVAGISQGETPEERFQNAFAYGAAGAILGGVLETAFGTKGKKIAESNVVQNARINNAAQIIMSLPAKDALGVSVALSEGIPFDRAMVKQVPIGEVRALFDLESVSPEVKNPDLQIGPRYFYRNKNTGKINVLVDNVEVDGTKLVNDPVLVGKAKVLQAMGFSVKNSTMLTTRAVKQAVQLLGVDTFNAIRNKVRGEVSKNPNLALLKGTRFEDISREIVELADRGGGVYSLDDLGNTIDNTLALKMTPEEANALRIADPNAVILNIPAKKFSLDPRHVKAFERTGFIQRQVGTVDGREVAILGAGPSTIAVQALNDGQKFTVGRSKFKPLPELITADFTTTPDGRTRGFTSEALGTVLNRQEVHIDDIKGDLLPEELAVLERNKEALRAATEEMAKERARRLNATGYALDNIWLAESGRLALRPRQGSGVIHILDNAEQMDHYLPAVSGAAPDPFAVVAGVREIAPADLKSDPHLYSPAGERVAGQGRHLENKVDEARLSSVLKNLTPSAAVFRSMENLSRIPVWVDGLKARQKAALRASAEKLPYIKRVTETARVRMKGWSRETREAITEWIGTSSLDEYRREVKPNALEEAMAAKHAPWLKSSGQGVTPLKRVDKYLLQKTILLDLANKKPQDWYVDGKLNTGKLENALKKFEETELAGGPLTPNEWSLLRDITQHPQEPYNPLHVRELITKDVLQTPTRDEYAAMKKMTPEHIAVAKEFEKMFVDLADHLGIPESKRLFRYISHLQQYQSIGTFKEYNPIASLDEVSRDFFADFQRLGLRSDIIKDPVDILIRYINAGFKDRYIKPVKAQADAVFRQFIAERGAKAPKNSQSVMEAWGQYFRDVTRELDEVGTPEEIIAYDATDMYLANIGIDNATDRKSLIKSFTSKFTPSNLIKNVEMATQGMRGVAGIRDLTTLMQMILLRLGPTHVKRAGGWASVAEAWKSRKWMRDSGITPGQAMELSEGYDAQALREATEAAMGNTAVLPKMFDWFREKTFVLSGQPTVFEFGHALVYQSVKTVATEALNDWALRKIPRAMMEKKVKLETYSAGVIRRFNELAESGKLDEASQLLAEDTGYEILNHFGRANAPKFFWTKWGKVAGQFGQWPIWYLNTLADQVARARPKRVAEIAGWLGLSSGAFYLAQQQTGFNLQSWSLDPRNSLNYKGSPWFQALGVAGRGMLDPDTTVREKAVNQFQTMLDPSTGVLVPFPLYLRRDVPEMVRRAQTPGEPPWLVPWKFLGGSVDREQYPPP